MEDRALTRRQALRKATLAGCRLPLLGSIPRLRPEEILSNSEPGKPSPALKLGVATYSFRKLSTEAAIAALRELQVTSASVYKVHVSILLSTPEVCRERTQQFRQSGISLTSTGVVQLKNDPGVMRRAFECGQAAGLKTLTASYAERPDRDTLLLTERFVQEYDPKLAFHNHGPEDRIFPSPYDVWAALQPYDKRLGLCLDVGHSWRAGVDPAEAVVRCHERLYDVHLKDTLASAGEKKDRPVGLGFGLLDLRSILAALLRIHYSYQVGLEDEVDAADPIPGIAQSFGYMRGLLASLTPGTLLP